MTNVQSASSVQPANEELAALLALLSLDELGPTRLGALLAGVSATGPATTAANPAIATGPAPAAANPAPAAGPAANAATQALTVLRQPLQHFGGQLAQLLSCRGVTTNRIHTWATALRQVDGAQLLERHLQAGVQLETPAQLAQIPLWRDDPEPPLMLFRKGKPVCFESRRVAVVGTRRCSGYGRNVAQSLGRQLAQAGITVVSGLANGIDSAAQGAAQKAGGAVIGVVATGLDVIYPPTNVKLWGDIAESGTLLSEYPLGAPPIRWRFPARNRLIAALAEAVIVVESGASGGSFYTVEAAAERGVPVMAVPGPITVRTSDGPNALLADGCAIVRDIDDVLLALDMTAAEAQPRLPAIDPTAPGAPRPTGSTATSAAAPRPANLSPLESELLSQLVAGPATIDELLAVQLNEPDTEAQPERTQPGLAQVALTLDRLRQSGWVIESGGWWERVR